MRPWFVCLPLLFLAAACPAVAKAQDNIVVPAGTLLHCTLPEPNFTPKTVSPGDPVVCYLNPLRQFGRVLFPRGSYLQGHVEDVKEPGHFWGKGSITLIFDQLGLPDGDGPVDAKVVAARGYPVNREGEIRGKGHATRDSVEWLFPLFWPWKALLLPARGPEPRLTSETPVTLRVMEDVVLPASAATGSFAPGDTLFGDTASGGHSAFGSFKRWISRLAALASS